MVPATLLVAVPVPDSDALDDSDADDVVLLLVDIVMLLVALVLDVTEDGGVTLTDPLMLLVLDELTATHNQHHPTQPTQHAGHSLPWWSAALPPDTTPYTARSRFPGKALHTAKRTCGRHRRRRRHAAAARHTTGRRPCPGQRRARRWRHRRRCAPADTRRAGGRAGAGRTPCIVP